VNVLAAGGSPLFSLQFAQTNGRPLWVDSQQAAGLGRDSAGGREQKVRLMFEGFGSVDGLRVALDGRLSADEPFVRWTITVDTPGRQNLQTVRFPYVKAAPAFGDPTDDFLIGPALPGVIIENPAANWPANYTASWKFPGNQSVQFCAYQDRTAGVYLASMDTAGYGRSLGAGKQKDAMCLYQDFQLSGEPAAQWTSPYETALGAAAGRGRTRRTSTSGGRSGRTGARRR
jgi:hypothetical protein